MVVSGLACKGSMDVSLKEGVTRRSLIKLVATHERTSSVRFFFLLICAWSNNSGVYWEVLAYQLTMSESVTERV
jgi:hypothetical protein